MALLRCYSVNVDVGNGVLNDEPSRREGPWFRVESRG